MVEAPNFTSLRLGCGQKSQVEEKLYRNIEMSWRLGKGLGYLVGDNVHTGRVLNQLLETAKHSKIVRLHSTR